MQELYHRRRENLRRLVAERGGQKRLSDELGYSKGWLSQLIGRTPGRDLSEKVAREIEAKLGLPAGFLDLEKIEPVSQEEPSRSGIAHILSSNLRQCMAARGINQAELARRANMALTSVNRVFNALENGVSPRLETLAGIARGLEVAPADLLASRAVAPPPPNHTPPHTLARQVSRLVEDFLLCSPSQRAELLRLASEASTKTADHKPERQ